MAEWFRQHRESLLYRMPWHIPGETWPQAAKLGLFTAHCGETVAVEDRGIDYADDPPLDDRCKACQGAFVRGEHRGRSAGDSQTA